MPTINQLVRKGRQLAHAKTKSPALKSCPQKARRLSACLYVDAEEPNSALEKLPVRLTNGNGRSPPTFPVSGIPYSDINRAVRGGA